MRKKQKWIHEHIDFLIENFWPADPGDFLCDFSVLLYSLNGESTDSAVMPSTDSDIMPPSDNAFKLMSDNALMPPSDKQECQARIEEICSKNYWLRQQRDLFGRALAVMGDKKTEYLIDFLKNISTDKTHLYENSSEAFCYLLQTMFLRQYIRDFITPSTLCSLMASMIAPQKGEVLLDPVCGSGRLLAAAADYSRDCVFKGIDVNARMTLFAFFNMFFNGMIPAELYYMDFLKDFHEWNSCDAVLAKPPYEDDIHLTIDFVDKIMEALKTGGRCGILVPEGFLTSTVTDVVQMRRGLLEKYTLDGVVALPRKIYKPYTQSHSSLIMLSKQPAAHGHTVFLSRLPEWEGGDAEFSDLVYKPDMDRIAAAWHCFREKKDASWDAYKDDIAWSVSTEEIRQNDSIFAADSYIKPEFPLPEAQMEAPMETKIEELREKVMGEYLKLEQAIGNYFNGDFESWM